MGRSGLDWVPLCDAHLVDLARLAVLDELQVASPRRQQELLARLGASAGTGDAFAVRVFAVALGLVGQQERAAVVLRGVVSKRPEDLAARVDLARIELAQGNATECRDHLRVAAARDTSDLAAVARTRLAEFDRWSARRDDLLAFHDLRCQALRERIGVRPGTMEEYVALAVSLLTVGHRVEAIAVLEEVRGREPGHAQVLELLLSAKFGARDLTGVDEIVRDLESVAPHSPLLPVVGRFFAEAVPPPGAGWNAEVNEHMGRGLHGDARSLTWLREAYRREPRDRVVINALMCVESLHGDSSEAVRLADLLDRGELDHAVHLNVAQVYSQAGRRADAERHFDLAHLYANDDDDRADVAFARRQHEERA